MFCFFSFRRWNFNSYSRKSSQSFYLFCFFFALVTFAFVSRCCLNSRCTRAGVNVNENFLLLLLLLLSWNSILVRNIHNSFIQIFCLSFFIPQKHISRYERRNFLSLSIESHRKDVKKGINSFVPFQFHSQQIFLLLCFDFCVNEAVKDFKLDELRHFNGNSFVGCVKCVLKIPLKRASL